MSVLSFKIEDRNSIINSFHLPSIRYHKRVTFSNGIVLDYYFKDWIYQDIHYSSLEHLLESLPVDIQECILFNLETFRKI